MIDLDVPERLIRTKDELHQIMLAVRVQGGVTSALPSLMGG